MKSITFKPLFAVGSIALASGLACAQTASTSSVQIYGIVDAAYRHATNEGTVANPHQSLNQMVGGGMSQSRWGINVNEDLGGGMKALVNLENRFTTDTGAGATANYFQQSWVGVQGNFGRITLGRQYNVLFDLVTTTYASYPYSPYMEVYKPELGFALGGRQSNMIKYMAEVGAVRGALQYSFDERSPLGGKTLGGYLRYSANGLSAGAGYQDYQFASGKKIKAFTLGGSYNTGPWTVSMGYGENKVDQLTSPVDFAVLADAWQDRVSGGFGGPAFLAATKRTLYQVGAGYEVSPQIRVNAHYYHAKQSGNTPSASANANFFTVGADYAFSKRTDAYIEVDRTHLNGSSVSLSSAAAVAANNTSGANGSKSRTGFTVGLRHRF